MVVSGSGTAMSTQHGTPAMYRSWSLMRPNLRRIEVRNGPRPGRSLRVEHRRQRLARELHGLEVVDVREGERGALDADVTECLDVLEDPLGRPRHRPVDALLGE